MRIKILAYDQLVGVAQSISFRGSSSHGQKLWISRIKLDQSKLKKIFTQNQVYVAAQQYPMQIVIEEEIKEILNPMQNIIREAKEILKIHNAWITGMGHSFTSTDCVVVEDVHLDAEYITGDFTSVEKISDTAS